MKKISSGTGWRTLRRISQTAFVILFIYLAAKSQIPQQFNQVIHDLTSQGADYRLSAPVGFFFHLDPLVGVSTVLSTWSLHPALVTSLVVLLAVIVLGRVFCGFVCPFGAVNQVCAQVRPARKNREAKKKNQYSRTQNIKYYLLFFLLAGAAAGSSQIGLLDPFSFFYRGLTLAVFPALSYAADQFSSLIAEFPSPVSYLSYVGPMVLDPVTGYMPRIYQGAVFIGLLFLFTLAVNYWKPRFFCRYVCPLGALLGLFSRYSILNLTKDEKKCTGCGKCRIDCPGACGPHPDEAWQRHECHVCFNCQAVCPEDAIKFRFQATRPQPSPLDAEDAPDTGRRAVLASLLAGGAWVGLGRVSLSSAETPNPALVRPPGSLREPEFLARCIRCGLCMKVCPTNVITPAISEAGAEGFWTPVLNFRLGYCEYTCTLCTSVCPTGAIGELTAREKIETPIRIGSSFFDRGRCLPWSGQGPCLVCEEHCPVSPKAIYLVPQDITVDKDKTVRLMTPQVNLTRCIGCGTCSHVCPVAGRPAVYVTSVGETRSPGNQILLSGDQPSSEKIIPGVRD